MDRPTGIMKAAVALSVVALVACDGAPGTGAALAEDGVGPPGVVEIAALPGHPEGGEGWQFQLPGEVIEQDRTIDSGWTTFRLDNRSGAEHFILLFRAPDRLADITLAEWREAVTDPFQEIMSSLIDPAHVPASDLAEWFPEAQPMGGPGFVAAGAASEATVYLPPGTYFLDCYVKDDEGRFHSFMGMLERIEVTEADNGATEPEATMEVRISSNEGIRFDRPVEGGEHTVAVVFEDQKIHEHLLGHDLHLVRMEAETSTAELGEWMNWMAPQGLVAPAPAGFVGGVQTILTPGMLEGGKTAVGYFSVHLEPGRYAWVSEVPEPHTRGFLEEFEVP